MLGWLAAALVLGASVFCLLVWKATVSWAAQRAPELAGAPPPISVLKPLRGVDFGLEANLRSFFAQDYARFELLLCVESEGDDAVPVARILQREFPDVEARLIVTGTPEFENAKVWQLHQAWPQARHEIVVMSDSDIRVGPDFLMRVAPEFQPGGFDLVTCPYRAIGGPSYWSRLEAVGMNTEFLAGLLVARMLEGVRFAVGPTLVARKAVVDAVGGWRYLSEFLAEDFVLGQRAAERGFRVGLSRAVVEHRIGSETMRANFAHRVRWYRSTRRSRPAGYVGQLFTMPTPLVLIMLAVAPQWWPAALMAFILRWFAAISTLGCVRSRASLVDLIAQDLLSFGFWVAGFFGNTIVWRGRRFLLHKDGRFTRAG